jgi:hypothetical protein
MEAGAEGGRRVLAKYFERHPDERGSGLARKAEAALEANLARAYLMRGSFGKGMRSAGCAFVRDPAALPRELFRTGRALRSRAH